MYLKPLCVVVLRSLKQIESKDYYTTIAKCRSFDNLVKREDKHANVGLKFAFAETS